MLSALGRAVTWYDRTQKEEEEKEEEGEGEGLAPFFFMADRLRVREAKEIEGGRGAET